MLSCLCARRKPARRGTDCNLQRLPDPARLRRKPMKMSGYIAGAAAMALVALGPNAIAQQGPTPGQPGTTTGPAAGSTVQPSTAVQKETPAAGSRDRSYPGPTGWYERRSTGGDGSARYRGRTSR